jgi:transcription elongation factor Elf1
MESMVATARSYRRGVDYEDRYKCPACGKTQAAYVEFVRGDDGVYTATDECCNCHTEVKLVFRRMYRRNH